MKKNSSHVIIISSFIFDCKLQALLRQMTPPTVSGDPEWLPYDGPVAQVN